MIHSDYRMDKKQIELTIKAIKDSAESIRNSPDPKEAALKFLRDAGIIK